MSTKKMACIIAASVLFSHSNLPASESRNCSDLNVPDAVTNISSVAQRLETIPDEALPVVWRGPLGVFIQTKHSLNWMLKTTGDLSKEAIFGIYQNSGGLDNLIVTEYSFNEDYSVNEYDHNEIVQYIHDCVINILTSNNIKYDDDKIYEFSINMISQYKNSMAWKDEIHLKMIQTKLSDLNIIIRFAFISFPKKENTIPSNRFQLTLLMQAMGRPLFPDFKNSVGSASAEVATESPVLSGADKALIAILANAESLENWMTGVKKVKLVCD